MDYVLETKSLLKSYRHIEALSGVDMHVPKDSIYGLVGRNGAGKTTVINMLTGFYTPTSGTIKLNDMDTTNLSTDAHVKVGFCRTFQNIRLFKQLTVEDNILIGMQHRIPYGSFLSLFPNKKKSECEKTAKDEVTEILKRVGLEEYRYSKPGSLPYGMQRKLEIGRALAAHPRILLLDEPAAGMNPAEKIELSSFIKGLLNDVEGILLIEHDMKVIMSISDKIVVLNHGKKICEGKPSEVQSNPEVIEAYLGKGGAHRDVITSE